MSLCLLEEAVRCRLRSGVALTSVAHCVGELVENSIDADAKCIAVRIDLTKFKIQVIDNGHGLARRDLDLIGQRYVTSKCHTLHDLENDLQHLGYRGEALASIVDTTGTVEIMSRHRLSQQTYSKIFYHGGPAPVTLSSTCRPSIGTTVTLHDFFYNVPVRRRTISEALEIENIRQMLQALALANPTISFSLRNDALGECVMQIKKTSSLLGSFSALFGASRASSMREVNLRRGHLGITGIVSVESHYSKALQFVFINGRVVKKTSLHSCVNNIVANSLIGRSLSRQADPSKWSILEEGRDIISPRRNIEKHGMYVLMVECPRTEYDICFEPAKTLVEFKNWDTTLDVLTEMMEGFLRRHSLSIGLESAGTDNAEGEEEKTSSERETHCVSKGIVGSSLRKSMSCFRSEVNWMPRPITEQEILLSTNEEKSCLDVLNEGVPVSMNRLSSVRSLETGRGSQRDLVQVPSHLRLHGSSSVRSPLLSRSLSSKLSCLFQKKIVPVEEERKTEGIRVSRGDGEVRMAAVDREDGLEEIREKEDKKEGDIVETDHVNDSECEGEKDGNFYVSSALNLHHEQLVEAHSGTTSGVPKCDDSRCQWRCGPTFLPSTSFKMHPAVSETVASVLLDKSGEGLNSGMANRCSDCNLEQETAVRCSQLESAETLPLSQFPAAISCSANTDAFSCTSDSFTGKDAVEMLQLSGTHSEANVGREKNRSSLESGVESQNNCADSLSSLWKEGRDPSTRKPIYIHKRTGKTSAMNPMKPRGVASVPGMPTGPSDRSLGNLTSELQSSVASASGSIKRSCTSDYGSRPLRAAPHLSFDFDLFVPSSKRLRMSSPIAKDTHPCCGELASTSRDQAEEREGNGFVPVECDMTELVNGNAACAGSGTEITEGTRSGDFGNVTTALTSGGDEAGLSGSVDCRQVGMFGGTEVVGGVSDDDDDDDDDDDRELLAETCERREDWTVEVRQAEEGKRETTTWERGSFERLLESWTNPTFLAGQQEIASVGGGTRTQVKVHNIIHGYKFTRDMFNSIQVLGQVDRKFIACIVDVSGNGEQNLVVLFDQHAAHERVRLEALLNDLYETDGTESKIKTSQVYPPLLLALTLPQANLSRHFRSHFQALGVSLVCGLDGGVSVASVPSVLVQREASERRRGRPSVALDLVQEMIVKHLEVLRTTSGASQMMPASLTNILHSQACRSAVKFGDLLSAEECTELIKSLSTCKLPFQCAHGRPSLVPILDLDILKKKYPPKVENKSLSKKLARLYNQRITKL